MRKHTIQAEACSIFKDLNGYGGGRPTPVDALLISSVTATNYSKGYVP